MLADSETLRIARSVASPQDWADAYNVSAFLPSSDAEALAIVVLTRLSVDGIIHHT